VRPSDFFESLTATHLYNSLISPHRLLYAESALLKMSAIDCRPFPVEAIPMRSPSTAAHELLCLYLKSFYGLERCSPSTHRPAASTVVKARPAVRRRGRLPF
jgi:hypothetical protein